MTSGETLLVSTITGLATSLGALMVILIGHLSGKSLSALLGFAAGIMIAISTLNLMPSAIQLGNIYTAGFGFLFGVLLMLALDNFVPHLHYLQKEGKNCSYLKMGYFVASGIALHNLPEGLALGAGFKAADEMGIMIAAAILLHNIPEGMGIAAPLKKASIKNLHIIGITSMAGLFTPLGTLLGIILFGISSAFISISMGIAAGAMIYIVSDELIPESHKQHSHSANIGFALGILLAFLSQSL